MITSTDDPIPLRSFLSFYPSKSCHVLACQFETQWPNDSKNEVFFELFTNPVERALAWLGLWHLPEDHGLYLPETENSSPVVTMLKKQPLFAKKNIFFEGHLPKKSIAPWGFTPGLLTWLKKRNADALPHPHLAIIRKLHDKRFIENWRGHLDDTLPGGWITTLQELQQISARHPQQVWLIKRPWCSAGRGNEKWQPSRPSCIKKITHWRDLDGGWIVQPFVNRVLDFSSLWWIHSSGQLQLFGMTRMQTSAIGRYGGCDLGPQDLLFGDCLELIHQHVDQAQKLAKACHHLGYFGPLGLDGMIFTKADGKKKQVIIEMNVRQTLAMHLICIAKTHFPDDKRLVQARLVKHGSVCGKKMALLPPTTSPFQIVLE